MKKLIGFTCALFLTAIFLMPTAAVADTGKTVRVFVKVDDASAGEILKRSLDIRHDFGSSGFTVEVPEGVAAVLDARPGIHIEMVKVYQISKPPGGCEPWPDCNKVPTPSERPTPSDQTPWGIETMYGDTTITATSGGNGINVAVLDTGVNTNHPDVTRRVTQCVDFTVKAKRNQEPIKVGQCSDTNGHGTHVAGTILADGGADGKGIYGVAPEASLLAYKVCSSAGCWSDDIGRAIRYAADHGANIVSMSFGSDYENTLEREAITYAVGKGVLLVAAAGNDGPAIGSIDYPAANVNVMAVGAIDIIWNVPSWSSRGINDGDYVIEEREVEFGAPGVNIESIWKDGSYYFLSGTSMATPHVSGMAAKMWQGSASSTRTYLHNMAEDIWTYGDDIATGFGLPHL